MIHSNEIRTLAKRCSLLGSEYGGKAVTGRETLLRQQGETIIRFEEGGLLLHALREVAAGQDLTRTEAESAMEEILRGRATDAQIAGLLTALHVKGETVEELVGFATAMSRHAEPVFRGRRADGERIIVDTCGTGGDAKGTFNISTATAFVVAGAGVLVAKHGNRSISSRCGSADVLEALGVRLDVRPTKMGEAIEKVGIGFLFAPTIHRAMRHAMKARRELGVRTVFNLLGPLTNPAGAAAQVVGVYRRDAVELMAQALAELGVERGYVVHSEDGLDEISLSSETYMAEVRDGMVRMCTVAPEDFGLQRAPIQSLAGGTVAQNARIIGRVLGGENGPRRDIVLANAAATLVAAGVAVDFPGGVKLAKDSIDSGAAAEKLSDLVAFTRGRKGPRKSKGHTHRKARR